MAEPCSASGKRQPETVAAMSLIDGGVVRSLSVCSLKTGATILFGME